MNDLTPQALAVFHAHHGVATGPMLQRAGISRNRRRRLVSEGLLSIEYRRVYRLAGSATTLESRCAALCLEHPQGFITGPTAGRLIDLRRVGPTQLLHFCVPHGSNIGPIDGVILRQSTRIGAVHIQRRRDGIVIASAPRLAFDLAANLPELDHASVVEQILSRRLCTLATLGRVGRELVHPGRPGSMLFVKTLATRISGGPLESHPEVRLAKAMQDRGVPIVAQVADLELPNGISIRIDLAVPSIKWAIEVDVFGDHFLLEGGTKDRRRDRQCHQIGWQVDRVTPLDLADFDNLCDELVDVYRARCRAAA